MTNDEKSAKLLTYLAFMVNKTICSLTPTHAYTNIIEYAHAYLDAHI